MVCVNFFFLVQDDEENVAPETEENRSYFHFSADAAAPSGGFNL